MRLNLKPQTFWKLIGIEIKENMTVEKYKGDKPVGKLHDIDIYVSKNFNDTFELE